MNLVKLLVAISCCFLLNGCLEDDPNNSLGEDNFCDDSGCTCPDEGYFEVTQSCRPYNSSYYVATDPGIEVYDYFVMEIEEWDNFNSGKQEGFFIFSDDQQLSVGPKDWAGEPQLRRYNTPAGDSVFTGFDYFSPRAESEKYGGELAVILGMTQIHPDTLRITAYYQRVDRDGDANEGGHPGDPFEGSDVFYATRYIEN